MATTKDDLMKRYEQVRRQAQKLLDKQQAVTAKLMEKAGDDPASRFRAVAAMGAKAVRNTQATVKTYTKTQAALVKAIAKNDRQEVKRLKGELDALTSMIKGIYKIEPK